MRKSPRLGIAVLLVLGLAALSSVPATALDDTKPGVGCADLSFKDPKGDAFDGNTLGAFTADDNEDIIAGWFKYDGTTVTANTQVVNLSQNVPSDASYLVYYFFYTSPKGPHYVSAQVNGDGKPVFMWGTVTTGQVTTYDDVGPTKGKFFEGSEGVVQIELPVADTPAGATLKTPYAEVDRALDLVVNGLVSASDSAPDSQKGLDYAVGSCTDGGAATPAVTKKIAKAAALPLLLPGSLGSAKKASKAKAILIKVKAKGTVTNVKLTLANAAGKVVGTGSAAKVSGNGKIKLKLKGAVKAGNYVLTATGTAGGKKGTTSRKAKLSK
jgi:hypothetical protein